MRYTQYYIPTLREIPSEAELDSHKLMLRAGLIRKAAAGLQLTLGHRVKEDHRIVEEEMDRAGGYRFSPDCATGRVAPDRAVETFMA